ncbi:hypothetical protein ACFX1Q_028504 [Malus domestica]
MNSVRVLISVDVNHDWPLFQMEVKNVFLHGELKEDVYMHLPPGHPQEGNDSSAGKLVVLIYVDDLIVTCDNLTEIQMLKGILHGKFAIKDLGTLKYFLRIEITSSSKGLLLNQRKYILDLLQE